MHGLGNDFVLIDGIQQAFQLSPEQYRFLADRHFGIGCDQILLIEKSSNPQADFRYRIFNADGSEVEQCGNGVRCFARYVKDQGLTKKTTIAVETRSGIVYPRLEENGEVTVNMGIPEFEPRRIPFLAENKSVDYLLRIGNQHINIGAVSMGNPHAILLVDDLDNAPIAELGPLIEKDKHFPNKVNVGFMQVVNSDHIRLRVHERGVGETLACGTGACAAVVVGRQQGLINDKVTVQLPGGRLFIHWPGNGRPVWMTGPASYVYEGTITL
ncbi:Diaminopimelate epimerase [hydrothermal vent metagenome]|uniref:diaminopimelate epimerase n=1 Tax=hydrothermal vent metagenome TaxID=652676 RepID=A0A3B0Z5M5_9ZZZZ